MLEKKGLIELKLNNRNKSLYKGILEFLQSLSNKERWNFIIELIIDVKFMEYDDCELT